VELKVILSEQNMNIAKQDGLEKKFNLTTTIGTSNMQLFDSDGKIQKYDTPEDSEYIYSTWICIATTTPLPFSFCGFESEIIIPFQYLKSSSS
jgi:hypothetical protein